MQCCEESNVPVCFYLTCEKTKSSKGGWLVILKGINKEDLVVVEDYTSWIDFESAIKYAESTVDKPVEWTIVNGTNSEPLTLISRVSYEN